LLILLAGAASASPNFTPLGLGGGSESTALRISPDGSTVVGSYFTPAGPEPFRWTAATGMQFLGNISGTPTWGIAFDTSSDGSVIVGVTGGSSGQEAFRWTEPTGMVALGSIYGTGSLTAARGLNADGTTVVGMDCAPAPPARPCEAFTWNAIGGTVGQGFLDPTGTVSNFNAVSADGTIAVGLGDSASGQEVLRWTAATGLVGLGFFGGAHDISADGSTIVGHDVNGLNAFAWTQTGGLLHIPRPAGLSGNASAYGVSGDGSTVVGDAGGQAIIWTAANGTKLLLDELVAAGLGPALAGWTLQSAQSISDDGQTVAGFGLNPAGVREAFVATIPEPGTATLIGSGLVVLASARRRRAN